VSIPMRWDLISIIDWDVDQRQVTGGLLEVDKAARRNHSDISTCNEGSSANSAVTQFDIVQMSAPILFLVVVTTLSLVGSMIGIKENKKIKRELHGTTDGDIQFNEFCAYLAEHLAENHNDKLVRAGTTVGDLAKHMLHASVACDGSCAHAVSATALHNHGEDGELRTDQAAGTGTRAATLSPASEGSSGDAVSHGGGRAASGNDTQRQKFMSSKQGFGLNMRGRAALSRIKGVGGV